MKAYRTTKRLDLFTGRIGLTERQAAPRLHTGNLSHVEGCVYSIERPIQFKIGEIIGLTDEVAASLTISPVADLGQDYDEFLSGRSR